MPDQRNIGYANLRRVSVEQVIRVEVNEGAGTAEDYVGRVVYWFTMDGQLISHNDHVVGRAQRLSEQRVDHA